MYKCFLVLPRSLVDSMRGLDGVSHPQDDITFLVGKS